MTGQSSTSAVAERAAEAAATSVATAFIVDGSCPRTHTQGGHTTDSSSRRPPSSQSFEDCVCSSMAAASPRGVSLPFARDPAQFPRLTRSVPSDQDSVTMPVPVRLGRPDDLQVLRTPFSVMSV
jgi:hypothetical protein